jgi:protein-S-isoprenylcysteine O-methyltransferase Ste14
VSRGPAFADRPTRAAFWLTALALAALVGADLRTRRDPGDVVRDEGTGGVVAAAIAVAVATGAASLLHPGRRPLPRRRRTFPAGIACAWAGVAVNRAARRTLGAGYRPVVTVVAGQDVVTTGPYRLVRHPMYVGSALMCLGAGAVLGTVPTALAWALVPVALVRRIVVEERVLAEALGARYEDYARGRARLVPGIW